MDASFVGRPTPNRLRGVSRSASDISTGVFGHPTEQPQPTIGPIEPLKCQNEPSARSNEQRARIKAAQSSWLKAHIHSFDLPHTPRFAANDCCPWACGSAASGPKKPA